MTRRFAHLTDQLYFLALAAINAVHGLLPFCLRPALYRLCRFDIARSATLQGGVRFFHVGRLRVGDATVVDRGSFVLPYDHQLVRALAARGETVAFYGSRTRYNGEFLEAMRTLPGVT